ncbi:MAG: hypothetical protein AB7T63_17220 [Planctomycetota bacterium]
MVTVTIGGETHSLDDALRGWLQQHLRKKEAGLPLCVIVHIKKDDIDLRLAAGDCPPGGGGYRPPRPSERQIIDAWNGRGLGGSAFKPGDLISMLQQFRRLC